jgi:iron complex outermembrane receptor protein
MACRAFGVSILRGALIGLLLPGLAIAQSSTDGSTAVVDPWAGVEEMIVSGTSINQALTQATISVAGFDSEDLLAIGATDVAGLAEFTPNLEIKSAFAASNPTIFIRGVGLDDARANASSSVAILYDDVYMNSPAGQLAQMFDTEQVDVLRGPQGTFFGRNASAGAIRIISNRPTGNFSGYVTGTYGRFQHREVEAMLEAPIVPDILAFRMAGRFMQRDGYLLNRCARLESRSRLNSRLTGCAPTVIAQGPEPKEWLNDADNWAARGIFRLTPLADGDTEILLNVHGSQNRSLSTQFQVVGTGGIPENPRTGTNYIDADNCTQIVIRLGRRFCDASVNRPEQGDPYAGGYFRTPKEKLDLFGTSLKASWSSGPWSFKSISAYEWHDRDSELNLDASPATTLEPLFSDKAYQLTQDLEIGWNNDDGISVTVGGFYLYERLEVFNIFFGSFNFAPLQDQTQRTRYLGVFAHTRWEISEVLSIEGGIRVNNERKTFSIRSSTWNRELGEGVPSNDLNDTEKANETQPTGEFTVNYTPTPEISFYGKFTRGFKGPHFNGAAVRSIEAIIEPADSETVDAFEFGIKSHWFDDTIELDLATFYYNYKNQQVFQNRSITSDVIVNELINANDTRVAGVEASFNSTDIVPLVPFIQVPGLRSSFSFAYLYTEYTNFVNVDTKLFTDPSNPIPIAVAEISDFSGNQLVSAPEFSFTGNLSYAWDVGSLGTITPRFDYSWRSKVFFTPDNEAQLGDRSRLLLNARLSWSLADGNIEVAGWVRNLSDNVARVTALDLQGALSQINYVMNEPRTYGLTATLRF